MVDSDVESFGDNSISNLLVNDNANGSRIDVENLAGSAVVVFVGHALVDGSIDNNINVVANFVGGKGSRDMNSSDLPESFSKFMSSLASLSVAMGHS